MDVIESIRMALPRLRPAEAKVGQLVLADPDAALESTVASLAQRAGVSQASVVRFTRALGLSGLPALRIELAQELSRQAVELERSNIAQGQINPADTVAEVVAKLAFHEARSIEQTARDLDLEALDQVAQAIADGHHVVTFGVGASGLAAADLAQKLQRIGLMCLSSHDTHVQLVHAALADPATVAVAFSFGGRTVEVLRAQQIARQGGALTVAVTNDPESPVARASQLVLRTSAREAAMRAAALASRMAQLAVVDFLFVRVAQLRFDDLGTALKATFEAVGEQHLPPSAR
ncbi:MAG: MurR/RpiR family transcriptional regulator [Propionibacteriaceae bacterium]|nr:MurR/RpiR family transcriptional regulator [Propionibacteriaceae bacterium]